MESHSVTQHKWSFLITDLQWKAAFKFNSQVERRTGLSDVEM